MRPSTGTFKGIYIQGEDILQSDPDTKHVSAGLAAMECVVVQDLFLNETANYAHVFLPGSTFLEKDGTFTNAERRINRVRKVMSAEERLCRLGSHPEARPGDGPCMELCASVSDHGRDRRARRRASRWFPTTSSTRWARCSGRATRRTRAGSPIMHIDGFVRGKGKFIRTEYVATDERTGPRFPLLLTTGRILSQYNVGAQTRRTENVTWHAEDRLEIHPHDAEQRGIKEGDWIKLASRSGDTTLQGADHRSRRAGRGLYDLPPPEHAGKRHHHRLLRLGDQLPGIQGDSGAGVALKRPERMAERL
jgi:formate dehydrogenase major subunit